MRAMCRAAWVLVELSRNLAFASSSIAACPFVTLGTAGTISVIDQNHRSSGGPSAEPCEDLDSRVGCPFPLPCATLAPLRGALFGF
jgi:hypothetical protein